MFVPDEYRKKALGYAELAENSATPTERNGFQALEQSFRKLADNEQWLADNHSNIIEHAASPPVASTNEEEEEEIVSAKEEHMLRCIGASVILLWNTIPTKLQRELFDTAGSMGNLEKPASFEAGSRAFCTSTKMTNWITPGIDRRTCVRTHG